MDNATKLQIVEAILERTASVVGDITESVMAEFYRMAPEVQDVFKQHRPVDTGWLEAGMVEQALYCFMDWYKSPGEIKMTLLGSVPHHVETLNVSADHYHTLLQATATIVGQTIPPENQLEIDVWNETSDRLHEIVDTARQYAYSRAAAQ